jgi:hypothetical protein
MAIADTKRIKANRRSALSGDPWTPGARLAAIALVDKGRRSTDDGGGLDKGGGQG